MVDINRNQLAERYKKLRAEIRSLEELLWKSSDAPERLGPTPWNTDSLLAKIDELDTELVAIERLLPDIDSASSQESVGD